MNDLDVNPDKIIEEMIPEGGCISSEIAGYTLPVPVVDGNCLGLLFPVSGWTEITSL